jgi:hypothetical protein
MANSDFNPKIEGFRPFEFGRIPSASRGFLSRTQTIVLFGSASLTLPRVIDTIYFFIGMN